MAAIRLASSMYVMLFKLTRAMCHITTGHDAFTAN